MFKQYGDWIGQLMPDALIPVPVHKERYRKRGFNQAELVAKELGKYCKIPVISDFLIRVKNTLPQKELSDRERSDNLRHAFSVRNESQELSKLIDCVIIIDDIYTTGSTIEACTRTLQEVGVKKVYFLCVCIGQGC
jgi:ComF family protein